MRILLTNDDGIHSAGLWAAAKALRDVGEVTVVAPDRDLSGIGTAVTLATVVRAREIDPPVEGVQAFSVEGTPADCVILAAERLAKTPIDLVVSGINQGSNLGLDIMTSGTVGGAFQGLLRRIPSMAVSVAALTGVRYETAARTTRVLAQAFARHTLATPFLLNVNVPNSNPDGIEGVEMARLGPRAYLETVEEGNDGRGPHYWIKHDRPASFQDQEGTDIWAVHNNRISITPLCLTLDAPSPPATLGTLADEVAAELGLAAPVDTTGPRR